jgi:hypothetical protein
VNAVIYYSYDDIRIEDRPITISDSELLVQVHGCGLISHCLPLEQFHEGVALRYIFKLQESVKHGKYTV